MLTPLLLKPHERAGSEKNKAIKRKFGSKVIEEGIGATALVWNSARHFHLIENGHNLVRGGRVVGFSNSLTAFLISTNLIQITLL